ncbi:F-box domain-containing protein/FBD domain-containing protein [Cephalotus follicularis]|uniref:F-box domain-containing protein/FBD domain-containing protein n=1 Tax=Cephalotus follicularis TaxID=3775 RepID=A0A1Q3BH08_CEPFO|nr:F-box domain-containing protein/FBD domain-containing protein [Cephalotus follicularis]
MHSKKCNAKNGNLDIISTLPDAVLGHILSFLLTGDAVATSVLSKRWKYLWTLIHNLEFDSIFCRGKRTCDKSCFVKFVDRVLDCCQSQNIQKFDLRFYGFSPIELPSVHRWICYSVERNVYELRLRFPLETEGPVKLPKCLSTCRSLVLLELDSDFVFEIPSSVACFPSLKILHVSARNPDGELMEKLFVSCPILEDLTLYGNIEGCDDPLTFNIAVPTLKKLAIDLTVEEFHYCSVHTFVVKAPNLEYLKIQDDTLECYTLNEMPSFCQVYVDVGNMLINQMGATKDEVNHAMELIRGIKNTKSLELSFSTMAILSYAFEDNVLIFPNLTHLKVGIDSCFGWKLLQNFLKNSPNLEALVLKKEHTDSSIYPYENELEEPAHVGYDWIPPENVPSCLLFHLKTIHIKDIEGEEDELGVIKYLLENGLVLEKMSIKLSPYSTKELFNENMITMFPMGSKNCRIKFV